MSTQYLDDVPQGATKTLKKNMQGDWGNISYAPPRTRLQSLLLLSRAEGAFALTMPAICGAILAWWELGQFSPFFCVLTTIIALSLIAGINILADYQDYKNRKAPEAKYLLTEPYHAGSNLLVDGLFQPNQAIQCASALIGLALACTIGLTVHSGWPVLFFVGLSMILLCAFLTPPPYRGYLKWGIGEVCIFFGAGLLPLFYGFYVQSGTLTALTLWLSVPFGLLSVLVVFAYSFVHQRTDWIFGRRTLVVTLGEKQSMNLGTLLVLLSFLALLIIAVYTDITLWILLGLVGLPIAMNEFKQLYKLKILTPNIRFHLYQTITKTAIVTGLMLLLALWLDGMF